ncbi:MAG: undecaprenyl diphosphate synthase family protein [Anaerovoracaceae bacterium]
MVIIYVEQEVLPRHVAVIMDGNGRWAQKNKVNRLQGHNASMLAMKEIIRERTS